MVRVKVENIIETLVLPLLRDPDGPGVIPHRLGGARTSGGYTALLQHLQADALRAAAPEVAAYRAGEDMSGEVPAGSEAELRLCRMLHGTQVE